MDRRIVIFNGELALWLALGLILFLGVVWPLTHLGYIWPLGLGLVYCGGFFIRIGSALLRADPTPTQRQE